MAAITFHAEKCCHLVGAHAASTAIQHNTSESTGFPLAILFTVCQPWYIRTSYVTYS